MAILIDQNTKVLVQGVTGNSGKLSTKLMKEYGTHVVAGVTPGKGGQEVEGVPVYDSVKEALQKHPEINFSAVYVPPFAVKDSVIEAIDNGIKIIYVLTEGVAIHDVTHMVAYAKMHNAIIVGPSSIGIISPGLARIGFAGGSANLANMIYAKGNVGVISSSGGMTNETAWIVRQAGLGQSTVVGIGGDVIRGTGFADLLRMFEKDPETHCVVMFSEPGGTYEDRIVECIKNGEYTKPLVAFIGGKFIEKMPEGMKFGHAGTLIEGNRGTPEYKTRILREVGVLVADKYQDLGQLVKQCLGGVRNG